MPPSPVLHVTQVTHADLVALARLRGESLYELTEEALVAFILRPENQEALRTLTEPA